TSDTPSVFTPNVTNEILTALFSGSAAASGAAAIRKTIRKCFTAISPTGRNPAVRDADRVGSPSELHRQLLCPAPNPSSCRWQPGGGDRPAILGAPVLIGPRPSFVALNNPKTRCGRHLRASGCCH